FAALHLTLDLQMSLRVVVGGRSCFSPALVLGTSSPATITASSAPASARARQISSTGPFSLGKVSASFICTATMPLLTPPGGNAYCWTPIASSWGVAGCQDRFFSSSLTGGLLVAVARDTSEREGRVAKTGTLPPLMTARATESASRSRW